MITRRLETGVGTWNASPTCSADEVAIHLIIDFVTDLNRDGALAQRCELAGLPNGPGHDDLATAQELCLRDADVMFV